MYNNETGLHDYDEYMLEDAQWFDDDDGYLYIVPPPNIVAECEGPDNVIMDGINEACRDHDRVTEDDAERLGLTEIPHYLRRFNEEDGYYHA